jgi:hypothetical protein
VIAVISRSCLCGREHRSCRSLTPPCPALNRFALLMGVDCNNLSLCKIVRQTYDSVPYDLKEYNACRLAE